MTFHIFWNARVGFSSVVALRTVGDCQCSRQNVEAGRGEETSGQLPDAKYICRVQSIRWPEDFETSHLRADCSTLPTDHRADSFRPVDKGHPFNYRIGKRVTVIAYV